ncbi:Methyltransferase type 11 (plasmid) [Gloeothece citriformis PCC 7424]|uniref:Methyltransferase type 11 n=1 Tax=Gloeothece citriformis (strain PCC 7424) TaxID=65393 RepID=B7KM36_GLOC7|nr:class I SAM-dependent methyltransferase [Gloeothece citriformis]ACK73858.1 Methyltransferase type 11 [Gloeothece citriformis PCC 7424]
MLTLSSYLKSDKILEQSNEGILMCKIPNPSPGMQANTCYFGHPQWAKNYLEACHRDENFINLWQTVIYSWRDKIVVDIGCGPGNLYASLKESCGKPGLLIGVDVSDGALKMAQQIGYTPLLADAHNLPLISSFADIVMANACLHHCDDMAKVLAEAARLVRPGGLLITDHDPQQTAYNFRGLGLLLWQIRLPLYRLLKRGGHSTDDEQFWSIATEVHHKPGDGITPELYYQVLEPLGFKVQLYPHNHTVGAKVLQGNYGKSFWRCRIAQRLSGINPDTPQAALSLMCVAIRQV